MNSDISGIDRDALARAMLDYIGGTRLGLPGTTPRGFAETALTYIAAHHECACDREHADDEWVEVDRDTFYTLPDGVRARQEWVRQEFAKGDWRTTVHYFVHRDDLPDRDAARVERMAKAIHAADVVSFGWGTERERVREKYRNMARAALAEAREEEEER